MWGREAKPAWSRDKVSTEGVDITSTHSGLSNWNTAFPSVSPPSFPVIFYAKVSKGSSAPTWAHARLKTNSWITKLNKFLYHKINN